MISGSYTPCGLVFSLKEKKWSGLMTLLADQESGRRSFDASVGYGELGVTRGDAFTSWSRTCA